MKAKNFPRTGSDQLLGPGITQVLATPLVNGVASTLLDVAITTHTA